MEEVEAHGGMTKAVAEGLPKARIEEAAARKQAAIDRGEEVIVGVNKYKPTVPDQIDILRIDNAKVRRNQIDRLNRMRARRDEAACQATLKALEDVARTGEGNILAAAIKAARARASVGEISTAMENAWGRYDADTHLVTGVYGGAFEGDKRYETVKREIAAMAQNLSRKPKVLIVKMGQDGHDRGAKVIASAFSDLGFDVAVGPLFLTPEEAADLAMEENADVVGVSSHAAGHLTLAPMLLAELGKRGGADKLVICGGVIPSQDYNALKKAGVAAIYGPGTNILDSAENLLAMLRERLRGRNR
jgi:methylmalonyl-CoA mutase